MAVYADFPYYQDFYCGTSITDAAAFRTAAARASDYIDNVTFGRLASNIPETQYHYSVTYSTPAETLTALLSGKSVSDYLYSICLRYLGRTGLMYRGCD